MQIMRNAIGVLIVLWGLSFFFTQAFVQLEATATQILSTVESAALVSEAQLRVLLEE